MINYLQAFSIYKICFLFFPLSKWTQTWLLNTWTGILAEEKYSGCLEVYEGFSSLLWEE